MQVGEQKDPQVSCKVCVKEKGMESLWRVMTPTDGKGKNTLTPPRRGQKILQWSWHRNSLIAPAAMLC